MNNNIESYELDVNHVLIICNAIGDSVRRISENLKRDGHVLISEEKVNQEDCFKIIREVLHPLLRLLNKKGGSITFKINPKD